MLVSRFFRNASSGDRVGIELELEGVGGAVKEVYSNWHIHTEGSLRDGVELVSNPLTIKELSEAMEEVAPLLEQAEESDRCGLHAHINMGDITTLGLIKNNLLYLSLERAIINKYGMRSDNNYSIPFYKMQFPMEFASDLSICRSLVEGRYNKYSALNMLPLYRFGTIEYRGMGLVKDPDKIIEWAELLLEIKNMSKELKFSVFRREGHMHLLNLAEEYPKIYALISTEIDQVRLGSVQAVSELTKIA